MNILLIVSIIAFYSTQSSSIQAKTTKIKTTLKKTRTTTRKIIEKLRNVQFATKIMIIDPTMLFFQGK